MKKMSDEDKRQAVNRAWWKVHGPAIGRWVRKMKFPPTKFVGYDTLECETHILGIGVIKPLDVASQAENRED